MTVLRYPGIPYFQSDPCGTPQNIMKSINFPHRDIVFSLFFFSVLAVPWGTTTLVFSIVVGWTGLKMIKACSFSQHVVFNRQLWWYNYNISNIAVQLRIYNNQSHPPKNKKTRVEYWISPFWGPDNCQSLLWWGGLLQIQLYLANHTPIYC